jgi:hypothetical protein
MAASRAPPVVRRMQRAEEGEAVGYSEDVVVGHFDPGNGRCNYKRWVSAFWAPTPTDGFHESRESLRRRLHRARGLFRVAFPVGLAGDEKGLLRLGCRTILSEFTGLPLPSSIAPDEKSCGPPCPRIPIPVPTTPQGPGQPTKQNRSPTDVSPKSRRGCSSGEFRAGI